MDWLDRVKEEKEEITKKIEEFKIFYKSAVTNPTITVHLMFLLSEQIVSMKRYENALEEIIKYEENNK